MCNHLLNPRKYWVLKRDRRPQLTQNVTLVKDVGDPRTCKSLKRWRPQPRSFEPSRSATRIPDSLQPARGFGIAPLHPSLGGSDQAQGKQCVQNSIRRASVERLRIDQTVSQVVPE